MWAADDTSEAQAMPMAALSQLFITFRKDYMSEVNVKMTSLYLPINPAEVAGAVEPLFVCYNVPEKVIVIHRFLLDVPGLLIACFSMLLTFMSAGGSHSGLMLAICCLYCTSVCAAEIYIARRSLVKANEHAVGHVSRSVRIFSHALRTTTLISLTMATALSIVHNSSLY